MQRISAGRGRAGLEDPSCGHGGRLEPLGPPGRKQRLYCTTDPLPWRASSSPIVRCTPAIDFSPAPPLRLLPGALGPFRRAIGRRAGGSPAPSAPAALAPAPRARARPRPERAWPPIKEAGRARRRHSPLRSERRGAEAPEARRSLSNPHPPAPRTRCPHPQEPVRRGEGEPGRRRGRGQPTPGRGAGSPPGRGGARARTGEPALPLPPSGGEPDEPVATGLRRVGCGGAARPSLGAGGWNVIDWAEGVARPRVPPRPPPQPGRRPALPHPVAAGGAGAPGSGGHRSPSCGRFPPAPAPSRGGDRPRRLLFPNPHEQCRPPGDGGSRELQVTALGCSFHPVRQFSAFRTQEGSRLAISFSSFAINTSFRPSCDLPVNNSCGSCFVRDQIS